MSVKQPHEITIATLDVADKKLSTPMCRLVILSILAGAYISLGGALSVVTGFGFSSASADNPALQRLLSGATFPIGLILVVVLGSELFTGNNATLMPALVARRVGFRSVLRNWLVVWLGNFAGAMTFILLFVVGSGIFDVEPFRAALVGIAETKMSLSWLTVLFRGIGANWCVCLAIWLALSSSSLIGKMAGCWFPVMAFVVLGFEHSIANMFFIPAGMILGADVSVGALLFGNLLPATLGNIVGGAIFVGCVHAHLHLPRL